MRQNLSKTFSFVLILSLVLSALSAAQPALAAGTVSLTALDTPYAQDFDTLASSATSSVVPVGWEFSEIWGRMPTRPTRPVPGPPRPAIRTALGQPETPTALLAACAAAAWSR